MTLAENIVFPLVRYVSESRAVVISDLIISRKALNSAREVLCRRLAFPTKAVAAYEWELFCNTPVSNDWASVRVRADLKNEFFAGSVESRTLLIAEHYPELRQIWISQIHNWLSFFQRFCRDATKFLRRTNFDGATVARLQADVSDLHRGNNAVVRVSFRPGGDWFYKPRPAGHTATWFKLLSRINRTGFALPFEIPRMVRARDHHWMEAIPARRCAGRKQEQDFWFRAGALLYLVHCMRGVDFHTGNLICRADQPIFIDCETLGHPELPMPPKVALKERGLFRTGMLPLRTTTVDNVAALGVTTLQRVSGEQSLTGLVTPGPVVANGFRNMHSLLKVESRRRGIVPWMQRQLSRHECRAIYRPTAQYYFILLQSFSPRLLREEGSRFAFLVRACRAPHLAGQIIRREALALRGLDIPLFMHRAFSAIKLPSTADAERDARIIARLVPGKADLSQSL